MPDLHWGVPGLIGSVPGVGWLTGVAEHPAPAAPLTHTFTFRAVGPGYHPMMGAMGGDVVGEIIAISAGWPDASVCPILGCFHRHIQLMGKLPHSRSSRYSVTHLAVTGLENSTFMRQQDHSTGISDLRACTFEHIGGLLAYHDTGAFVLPLVIRGIIEASATRNP